MTRSSHTSIYDDDFFAWTQEQAAALRAMPAGAAGDAVDIAHVAEEIEDLGKRDLREVSSHLARLFEHLIKIHQDPRSLDRPHWSGEAVRFQASALDAFSPSMRQLLDLTVVWSRGRKVATRYFDEGGRSVSAPAECPFALDDILSADFDLDWALAHLDAESSSPS